MQLVYLTVLSLAHFDDVLQIVFLTFMVTIISCNISKIAVLKTVCTTGGRTSVSRDKHGPADEEVVISNFNGKCFYDKVSANGASSEPRCYKKSDGFQDTRRGYPIISDLSPDQ